MIGRIIRFHLRILIRISISFVSTGERNNEFFEFMFDKVSAIDRG